MAASAVPRTRGGISGILLILLGAATAVHVGRHAIPPDETEPVYPQEQYPAGS